VTATTLPTISRNWVTRLREACVACGPALLTAVAVAMWFFSLREVDLRQISDVGLITALGQLSFVALGLFVAAFAWSLAAIRPCRAVLLAQVVALVVILHGVTGVVEPLARTSTAWVHAGLMECIGRTGRTLPGLDARFSWPGAFTFGAWLTSVAGESSPVWLLRWAPLCFNLLSLLPLYVITATVTANQRCQWLALWLFALGNWIGQDYFAPQALGYVLFLAIIAVLLWYFDPQSTTEALTSPAQRAGLVVAVVLVYCAIVATHQLTPFFLIGAVGLLTLCRRTALSGLPLVMGVLVVAWISYGAEAFWSGHLMTIAGDVGRISQNLKAGLTDHLRGGTGRLLVQQTRLVLTAAVWVLAGVGLLRRLRRGTPDWSIVTLAAAPFPVILLQGYGGEMLLRIAYFALPFMACLGALAFYPSTAAEDRRRRWTAGLVGMLSAALVVAFLLARYGNERFESFTPGEFDAVRYLYDHAPAGSRLVALSSSLPWQYRDVERYDYLSAADVTTGHLDEIDTYRNLLKEHGAGPAYLVLTRAQWADIELNSGYRPDVVANLTRQLQVSRDFRLVYENPDATVFLWTPPLGSETG
jgi:hypothetical protein